jgi:hypothetical protein
MFNPQRRRLGGLVLAGVLSGGPAHAQQTARSFDELQRLLDTQEQEIVVIDSAGGRTRGTVAGVSASSLVLTLPQETAGPVVTRRFAVDDVVAIRAADLLVNGALVGAAVGAGLAMWDYLIDPSEPGNAVIFAVAIGVGTALGAAADALNHGGQVLYLSPDHQGSGAVLPSLAGNDGRRVFLIGGTFAASIGERNGRATGGNHPGMTAGAFINRYTSVRGEVFWPRPSTIAVNQTTQAPIQGLPLIAGPPKYVPTRFSAQYRTPYVFSGLFGLHPGNWNRFRLALLAGLTGRRVNTSISHERPVATGIDSYRIEVLESSGSSTDLVAAFGADAGIVLFRRLMLVPQVRIDLSFHGNTVRPGLGVQWAF